MPGRLVHFSLGKGQKPVYYFYPEAEIVAVR